MAEPFSAESRLIHAGTERAPGRPGTPPLVPAIARHLADHPRVAAVHYPGFDRPGLDQHSAEVVRNATAAAGSILAGSSSIS